LVGKENYDYEQGDIAKMNRFFRDDKSANKRRTSINSGRIRTKISLLMLGNPSPGGNNIVDGLLQFQNVRKGTTLVGYWNGVEGLLEDKVIDISEESFAPYRNLGGYDYLGSTNQKLNPSLFDKVAESVKEHQITGLVIVGATHELTDAINITEYFL